MGNEDSEVETIPEFICGIAIMLQREGKGVFIKAVPIDSKNVEREATPQDITMLLAEAKITHEAEYFSAIDYNNMIKRAQKIQLAKGGKRFLGRKH